MREWVRLYEEKMTEGHSKDSAYTIASNIMQERRLAFDPYSVKGMEENEAKEVLDKNGYSLRVVSRDVGTVGSIYLDYRKTRCNVKIEKGCVSKIIDMG